MAYFPELPTANTSAVMTDVFLGLNKGQSIADGEFADMTNMTADAYPVLSTRRKRMTVNWREGDNGYVLANPQGLIGTEKLVVMDDGKVYIDGEETKLTLSTEAEMQPKHVVCMGAYVCVWPDKKYINTANPDDYGPMGALWEASGEVSAIMCRKDGTNYDVESIIVSDEAPDNPEDGQMWLDTSGDNDVLTQYSDIYDEWVQVATTYIKLQAEGIGKGFKEGDAVFLSGASVAGSTTIGGDGGKPTFSEDKTAEFTTESFKLRSSFTTSKRADGTIVNSTPTTAERTKEISVTGIPEGASIKSAVLHVATTSPAHGYQVLTMNGKKLAIGENNIPVDVIGNGAVSFRFVFQVWAHGTEVGNHSGIVGFNDIKLTVTYAAPSGGETGSNKVDEQTRRQIDALNTSNMLYGAGDDYIIVAGLLRQHVALSATLKAEIKIPDLDYVCEANNRIWGCNFSRVDGELVNEIRSCALGDFRNWYLFEGTSMDSYVVSVGSDGVFTGAFSLKGNPLFFKENVMHRISGTQPSNFALNSTQCRGVQDGCWRSLTQVNETLYYKARTDVMAYDGSLPVSVSENLGDERYYEASAGAVRDKYYISMRDADQNWNLFVLDTRKGLWHREDSSHIQHFATVHGDMYMVQPGQPAALMSVNGTEGTPEEDFEWSVTFGVYGYESEMQKYLSRFNIRAFLEAKAFMKMEIMYDSDGIWVDEGTVRCPARRTFMIPVIPRRCDHCQVRLSGKGEAKIYSYARVLEIGGDG